MTALVTAESVVLLVLLVLVAGLLRSHADILKALHQLGVDLSAGGPATTAVPVAGPAVPAPRSEKGAAGRPAADLSGVTVAGEAAVVGIVGASTDTLVAFLSSGCGTCAAFWAELGRGAHRSLDAARTVVVTRDPTEESPSVLAGLAPDDVSVLMSSAAWDDYQVPGSPYFVYVNGATGTVAGEGTASRWDQLLSLCSQARADGGVRPGRRLAPSWSTDADREARADRDLMAAGIHPGHPSLYPPTVEDSRQ